MYILALKLFTLKNSHLNFFNNRARITELSRQKTVMIAARHRLLWFKARIKNSINLARGKVSGRIAKNKWRVLNNVGLVM